MSKTLEIQELAIVITAKNYDPNLLSPSFLKSSGIVSEDWELAREPIVNNRASQVVFNNGIYLAAQPNRFTSVEALNNKELTEVKISSLINRYVEVLRNLEYQAIGINLRGYVPCNEKTLESNHYLRDNFIVPGEWQSCGTAPVKAGLNLVFTYDNKQLYLSVNEAGIKFPESEQLPIVLFGGNFDYDLSSDSKEEKLVRLQSIVENWQQDLDIYRDVVNKMIVSTQAAKNQEVMEAVAA